MRTLLSVLALAALVGCAAPEAEPPVWLAHATDPQLFSGAAGEGDAAAQHRQALNRRAFSALLSELGSLPGGARPRFLVLMGDFGIAPVPEASAEEAAKRRETRVSDLAALLREGLEGSEVRDVFVVPGDDDLAGATGAAAEEVGEIFRALRGRLEPAGVTLHDLSGCSATDGTASQCAADLEGSRFRLVALPSHSFNDDFASAAAVREEPEPEKPAAVEGKPEPEEPAAVEGKAEPAPAEAAATRLPAPEAGLALFEAAVAAAKKDGRRVIALTHVPHLDDPRGKAEGRFAGRELPARLTEKAPAWSAWNLGEDLFSSWKRIVDSGAVGAVLSGSIHASEREIYRPPYGWSAASDLLPDPAKLILTPPLAVEGQESSLFQARGFSLLTLQGEEVSRRLFWLDPETLEFTPEAAPASPPRSALGGFAERLAFGDRRLLELGTVLAIAFLAAFLTVVQTWQIPPPPRLTTPGVDPGEPAAAAAGAAESAPSSPPANPPAANGPFQSNFARTVLGGLTGMVALTFFASFFEESSLDAKALYLVYFVAFFFGLLLLSALLRGAGEALRARVVLQYQPPAWVEEQPIVSSFRRVWTYVLSLEPTALVFFDTAFNVIQGKNETRTAAFGDEILDGQWSIVRTADRVRDSVAELLIDTLRQSFPTVTKDDLRISISVLSDDKSSVYYISAARGSLAVSFSRRSVAWISVISGEARWWTGEYQEHDEKQTDPKDKIVLLEQDPARPKVPVIEERFLLADYFQARRSREYEAFIVLPVPWSRRELREGRYRKGGIHISFSDKAHLDHLFPGLHLRDGAGKELPQPDYESWRSLLRKNPRAGKPTVHPELLYPLRQAVEVLGASLARFREPIFRNNILPQLRD